GTANLLRLAPVPAAAPAVVTFSGGVSEFLHGESREFGDLGARLARAIRSRAAVAGITIAAAAQGLRATVTGAPQYTAQVSGGPIFVSPLDVLPLRSLPVVAPAFAFADDIDAAAVAAAVRTALVLFDLGDTKDPVAVFVPWAGSATFDRLDAF